MDYKVYKFNFLTAVHFGVNTLESTEYTFCADTLFSALYQEALRLENDGFHKLYDYVVHDKLLLSDAFPFIRDTYFLPKPMLHIEAKDSAGDSLIKKAYKKLKYVPAESLGDYLSGQFDVLHMPDLNHTLGNFVMKISASVRGEEETVPYRIGTYSFQKENGLYIIVGYAEDEIRIFLEELLYRLSFSGIGGKRMSGMGRFVLDKTGKLPPDILRRLQRNGKKYMTLSVSLPRRTEIADALKRAEYLLCKRSGFVNSERYAPEQMRKQDLYVLKAGACVCNRYTGDVYDVSGKRGAHPVYRYAKPMFMEVDKFEKSSEAI